MSTSLERATATAAHDDSLPALVHGHRELHRILADELAALSPTVFLAPQGELWSPAQHLDHLVRSVRPLAAALRIPRTILRMRFGRGETSRPSPEVIELYLAKLAAGGGASGRYVPEVVASGEGAGHETMQQELVGRWRRAGDELTSALCLWREEELDRYLLPHPLLGKLTVREMVAWSLYHGHHHRRRIDERSLAAAR